MLRIAIIKKFFRASFLISIFAIIYFYPLVSMAEIKTTVEDILANPDQYDRETVQVVGWVSSLQVNHSRIGPYTTFKIGNQSGKTLSFVSLGFLPIKEGDFVIVTARYKKSDSLSWIYSIEGARSH